MTGKITYALTRKEADTYRSQGLPQAALAIYKNLLASSANLSLESQAAIREQIQKIKIEIHCSCADEASRLSDDQIALIRQGWSEDATAEEIIVSAATFHEMGRYADALLECKALLRKGVPIEHVGGLLASCLKHLHPPENVASAAAQLASEVCGGPVEGVSLQVLIAEALHQRGHFDHVVPLVLRLSEARHLATADLQRRLVELSGKLVHSHPDAPDNDTRPRQGDSNRPAGRSAGGSIRRALRQFVRRLRGGR
jgi:hypothetical protein